MEWTDTALILRAGVFREIDVWLHLLTEEKGLVSAFAFGGKRSRHRFSGCLDLFNLVRVRLRTGRSSSFLNLEEGFLLEGPHRLRQDWRRLGMMTNCVCFLEALGVMPENARSAFALTRSMLDLCEHAERLPASQSLLYRWRLASDQGYVPDFGRCGRCGEPPTGGGWFSVREGVLLCSRCRRNDMPDAEAVPAETVSMLSGIQRTLPQEWNDEDIDPGAWNVGVRLIDHFVQFHLGLNWENGRFRRR